MYLGRLSLFSDPLWLFLEEQPTRLKISLRPSETYLLIGSLDLFYGPSINKSIEELNDLVKNDVLEDFIRFHAAKEHKIIGLN